MADQTAAVSRPPLDYPAGPLEEILRLAAERWPDRTAITAADGELTFAELDLAAQRASVLIAGLAELAGGGGQRVAVATEMSAAFAAAFYGIVRSGNVAVTLNPLHRPEALARTIISCGAALAIVTSSMHERLAPLADSLPRLLPLSGDAAGPGTSLATLAAPATSGPGSDRVACLHYTSGTTSEPKGVLLTHRNLVVNAAQTVQAHGLDSTAPGGMTGHPERLAGHLPPSTSELLLWRDLGWAGARRHSGA